MLRPLFQRRWLATSVVILTIAVVAILSLVARTWLTLRDDTAEERQESKAPPDLERLRDPYSSGTAALSRKDGEEAVRLLSSFDFGPRAVEEYRLYHLATAYQLIGSAPAARQTLARLWALSPRMVHAEEAALNLAGLYLAAGDAGRAGDVYAALARRTSVSTIAAQATWRAANARLERGDVSGALYAARVLMIRSPTAPEAENALLLARAISGLSPEEAIPLTPSERFDRALALLAGNAPEKALEELTALDAVAPHLRQDIRLQRGIALHRIRRYDDSNKMLEPLLSGSFSHAIPALRHSAKNHAILAASINPIVHKTVKERKRAGTERVRVGKGKKRRTITRPKYQTVFRKVELIDLPKKKRKDEHERLASERLKDLLLLPIEDEVKLETLNALSSRALAKSQDEYLRELVPEVIKLNPAADPALQYFWDKAWAAYRRGDLQAAREAFRFISTTYKHPNVRRQSEYWLARTVERVGEKEEAAVIYRKLAAAPYIDLYSTHAISRGAPRPPPGGNPLNKAQPDWNEIAEKEMPAELRLAYELTALLSLRDAQLEIRRNQNRVNARFAEALTGDIHHHAGNQVLMYRALRKAWPQLATVEQDSVPAHFLRIYYPLEYDKEIEGNAHKRGLDPNLVRALILQESYYEPTARSSAGAQGLMQLMPATAAEHARRLGIAFGGSRLENPEVNIQLGTYHLAMLLRLFGGNRYLATAAYNAGQGNVAKWRRAMAGRPLDEILESIPFPETRNYVKRVTILSSTYERLTK